MKLLFCDSNGNMKFTYENIIITCNARNIFKWKTDSLNVLNQEQKNDIKNILYYYKNLMQFRFKKKERI